MTILIHLGSHPPLLRVVDVRPLSKTRGRSGPDPAQRVVGGTPPPGEGGVPPDFLMYLEKTQKRNLKRLQWRTWKCAPTIELFDEQIIAYDKS